MVYCDRCDGDTKIIKEDDNYLYFKCVDCGNVIKKRKPGGVKWVK